MPRAKMLAVALIVSAFTAMANAETLVFSFTAVPNQDEAELMRRFGKVAEYFEKKLGVRVVYVPRNSYENAVRAFIDNKVQLAWFGAYTRFEAREAVPGSESIAQGLEDTRFKSYFIAHVSAGIEPSKSFPMEIKGKTFVFGSPLSTSGRLVPEFWIRRHLHGVPQEVFSRVSFSGDHSSTLDLVQSGVSQIGVLNYTVFEAAKKAGKVDEAKVRVIWETPPFPDNSFVLRQDAEEMFGKGFKEKLKQAILDFDDPDILKSFGRSKFIPVENEQYEFIEEVARLIREEKSPPKSK